MVSIFEQNPLSYGFIFSSDVCMGRKVRCPRCRAETTWEDNPWRPFCSERCQMIDLGHWAAEDYRISRSAEEAERLNLDNDLEADEQV
jgi:hypothetical protein